MTPDALTELRPGRRVWVVNRRYPWPWRRAAIVVRLVVLFALYFLLRHVNWPYLFPVLILAYWAAEIGLLFFGPPVLRWNCFDGIEFGDELKTPPKSTAKPLRSLERIELAPDPGEDYDDSGACHCELTVVRRRGTRWRMLITVEDAVRLTEWAEEKGIPVVDTREPAGREPR